jgi:hypothetical protein
MKGENLFSRNIQRMALKNKLNEVEAKSSQLASNYQLSSKQSQIFETIRQGRLAAEQARTSARNAVIGNVLGVIGTVAGAALGTMAGGNTVTGAMVGGAVGKGIGNAVSPSSDGGDPKSALQSLNSGGGSSPYQERNEMSNGLGDYGDRMYGRTGYK